MEQGSGEMNGLLEQIRSGWGGVSALPQQVAQIREGLEKAANDVADVRRRLATHGSVAPPRERGEVSAGLARSLGAAFVLHCARSDALEALSSVPSVRDSLLAQAREALGLTTRTALSTSEVPLPTVYGAELVGLVSEYGVCRRRMMRYPITGGTARPARMGTRPAFTSIAMSAAVGEKSPSLTFASLESHKIGGMVKVPRELDEQSIVPMGQFLARYGAVEFARAEDLWGFLADGSGTYENVKGVVQVASDGGKTVTAVGGSPSEVTRAEIRLVRSKVNKAVLSGRFGAYYMDSSWEPALRGLNVADAPYFFVRNADGTATIDGLSGLWPGWWTM